jgi:hypothetical protein
MKRNRLRTVTLIAWSLWAACLPRAEGTTIVIFLSPQEVAIAADSLANRFQGGQHSVCKIVQISDHMLFAAAGIAKLEAPTHFDPYDLARISGTGARSPREAASNYARLALEPLQWIWRTNRNRYLEIVEGTGPKPNGPQNFVFIGFDADGSTAAVGGRFIGDAAVEPNLHAEMSEFAGKNGNDIFVWPMGITTTVSPNQINAWIYHDKMTATDALERAIKVQIAATPTLVGPPISKAQLPHCGIVEWVDRGACN